MQARPVEYLYKSHISEQEYVVKAILGIVFFVVWLVIFILGMSIEAKNYHAQIMTKDATLNINYLFWYAISLTPINVAILASVAGALGGIASNLAAFNKCKHLHSTYISSQSNDFESFLYMTENPLVSLLRGFTTYMIFIAGSYLINFTSTTDIKDISAFGGLTVSAYFKFAVSVSLLAYLAGYDPSRIKNFLSSVNLNKNDNMNKSQKDDLHIEDNKGNSIDFTHSEKATVPTIGLNPSNQPINGSKAENLQDSSR